MNSEKTTPKLGIVSIDNPSVEWLGPKPSARLVSWTPDMANVFHQVWAYAKDSQNNKRIITAQTSHELERFLPSELPIPPIEVIEDADIFLRRFFEEWMPISRMGFLIFELENIPPALLQQLSRHKHIEMFVKSARVFYDPDWAETKKYFQPDSVSVYGSEARFVYEDTMQCICRAINKLINLGVPLEDARGLLPMHSLYKMTLQLTVASLQQIVHKRTCNLLQQQLWAPLMAKMRSELVNKISPAFEVLFYPPCKSTGKCQAPTENKERIDGLVPIEPCPIFLEKFNTTEGK